MEFILLIIVGVLAYFLYMKHQEIVSLKLLLEARKKEDVEPFQTHNLGDLSDEARYTQVVEDVRVSCNTAKLLIPELLNGGDPATFLKIVDKAEKKAKKIPDPFYSASALVFVIKVVHKAQLRKRKKQISKGIEDPALIKMIKEMLSKTYDENKSVQTS